MIYGLYQSAAGMMVNEYRQGVISNNLANADTIGFKREIATFAERLRADQAGRRHGPSDSTLGGLSGGTWLGETATDFSEANFIESQNPYDVALAGPGFLRVLHDGKEYLSRDGRMTMTPSGDLVQAATGAAVLGPAGQPIRLDPRGGAITIDENGRISQGGFERTGLGIADVQDYDALRKVGGGRFDAAGQSLTQSPAKVIPGFVESSGVKPVQELATMIEASRAFQINAQMVSLQDQIGGRLINVVAA